MGKLKVVFLVIFCITEVVYGQNMDLKIRCVGTYNGVNADIRIQNAYGSPSFGDASNCTAWHRSTTGWSEGTADFNASPTYGNIDYINVSKTQSVDIYMRGFQKRCTNGNGSNCSYNPSCYCPPLGLRCSGKDDVNFEEVVRNINWYAMEPGLTSKNIIEVMSNPNRWYGVKIHVFYTPPVPNAISYSGGTNIICGGDRIILQTGSDKTTGDFVWQESINGGVWQDIVGQNSSTLNVAAPSNAPIGGFIQKQFRVYKRNNGTLSKIPTVYGNTFSIYSPAPIINNSSTYLTITHNKCYDDKSGKIQVIRVDGLGTYKYSLSGTSLRGTIINLNSLVTFPVFPDDASNKPIGMTGLPAGNYILTVENYYGGVARCPTYVNISITEPPRLTIVNVVSPLYTGYNISCKGGSNGSMSIIPTGGVSPYTYSINKAAFSATNNTGTFANLNVGTYGLTIQDANLCSVTSSKALTEPSTTIGYTVIGTDVRCNGNNDGVVTFNASGGVGSYNYSINNKSSYSANSVFNNLPPSTYICHVKDANGCFANESTIGISEPTKLLIMASGVQDATCFARSDGSFSVSGSGGLEAYKYSINNGLFLNGSNFSSLQAGIHNVKIKDGNNCINSIDVTVGQPEQLAIAFNVTQVQCNGFNNGNVTANVSGGITPYTYQWTGLTDTDNMIENLPPGNYPLKITDTHNCILTKTATVTQPANGLAVIITKSVDAKCNIACNGEAEVSVSGGTPPYSYTWNNNHSLNTPLISDLCKGEYEVKVLDNRNCIAELSTTINDSVQFNLNIPDSTILCPGKSLNIDEENTGYAYEWYKSGSLFSNNQSLSLNEDGSYSVKVTNPDGCFIERKFTLRISNEALKTNFILPSFVSLGDTVVFVEISQPLPDSLSWSFEGLPQIIDTNSESPVLLFNNEGSYKIKLTAYLGECIDSLSKTITFFIPPDDLNSSGNSVLGLNKIREIKLYPNPNSGDFKIEIGLDQVQDIDLRIYGSQGLPVTSLTDTGKDTYLIDYNLPLGIGVYLVKVQTATDYKTITFIVY